MAVTIEQVERGLTRYIDDELIPHLSTGKGVAMGIFVALLDGKMRDSINTLKSNELVKSLGIITDDCGIEIDRLYNAALPRFNGKKIPVSFPIVGTFNFESSDIEKLYRFILEA